MDTRISIYKLDVFCHVVESGSITRAAKELGVAQPVVTEHVRGLERRLEVTLLQRAGRTFELTEAGRAAYEWARDVVRRTRDAATAFADITNAAQNTVTIAACSASAATLLPGILLDFQLARPQTIVRLNHLVSDQAVRNVLSGECDFGLVSYADESIDTRDLPTVFAEWVYEEDLVPLCAPDHPSAGGAMTIAQLGALPFVCTPVGTARRRSIDRQFQRAGSRTRTVLLALAHAEPITDAVAKGTGVALLSRHSVTGKLASGELAEISLTDGHFRVRFALLRRRDRSLTGVQTQLFSKIRSDLHGLKVSETLAP